MAHSALAWTCASSAGEMCLAMIAAPPTASPAGRPSRSMIFAVNQAAIKERGTKRQVVDEGSLMTKLVKSPATPPTPGFAVAVTFAAITAAMYRPQETGERYGGVANDRGCHSQITRERSMIAGKLAYVLLGSVLGLVLAATAGSAASSPARQEAGSRAIVTLSGTSGRYLSFTGVQKNPGIFEFKGSLSFKRPVTTGKYKLGFTIDKPGRGKTRLVYDVNIRQR